MHNADERRSRAPARRHESEEDEAARLANEAEAVASQLRSMEARDRERAAHNAMRIAAPHLREGRRLKRASTTLRRIRADAYTEHLRTRFGLVVGWNRFGRPELVATIDAPRDDRDAVDIARDAKARALAATRSEEERFRAERYASQQAARDADAHKRALERQAARAAWAAKRRNAAKGR